MGLVMQAAGRYIIIYDARDTIVGNMHVSIDDMVQNGMYETVCTKRYERKNIRCETLCTLLGRVCQVAGRWKVCTVHTMCLVAGIWAVYIYICIYICINYIVFGMQICTLVQQQGTCRGVALSRCRVKYRQPDL